MAPRRGKLVQCFCSRCVHIDPSGRQIPSSDRRQHLDRDLERELRLPAHARLSPPPLIDADRSNRPRSPSDRSRSLSPERNEQAPGQASSLNRSHSDDLPAAPEGDVTPGRPVVQSESDDLPWLRLFMLLLLWLSCARGLSRACARIILSFLTDLVLPVHNISAPRHISTVRNHLAHQSSLRKFAICPNYDCQACWPVGLTPSDCHLCNTVLFSAENSTKPLKYFHYGSVIAFLQECFQDPEFEVQINHWRTRANRSTLADIYDGTGWDAAGFMDNRLHLYLSIGIDWFVPFSFGNTASYTIGAVTVRIENLPPSMRNQPEFMHVAAILPGPRQTSDDGLVSALRPMIDELRQLYDGIEIHTPGFPLTRTMKAKVLLALGDTPARAKLAGFPSHSQHGQWCGYCHADSHTWVDALMRQETPALRNPDTHRSAAFIVKANPAARDETIRTNAATWTALYDLPYWRSVRDVPVDAMHVLHLGACKRFWHATLVEGGLLPKQFPIVAAVIKSATYPRTITTIRPNFGTPKGGSPTSDAWSTFTRFLLPLVLASHWADTLEIDGHSEFTIRNKAFRPSGLPQGTPTPPFTKNVLVRHLVRMAADLSLITHIVQGKEFTEDRLQLLERLIRDHIFSTATHIDPRWLVSNHHAMTHLPDHIRRFGPPRTFWFYSMERMNGFLKKTLHNEHHSGELEYSMQTNHALFRAVRRQIRAMGDSEEEVIFRRLLVDEDSQLDPFEVNGEEYLPTSPQAQTVGEGEPIMLGPSTVSAIVNMVNSTRGAADPIAEPELACPDRAGRILIASDAMQFPHMLIKAIRVSPKRSRINIGKGASNIMISSNTGRRAAKLILVFEHTHSNPQTGQLVRQAYAEVEIYQRVEWPRHHVLSSSASRLGYHLYSSTNPQPGVLPLQNIVDTYVSATAEFITNNRAHFFAAELHP
ncbi:hypothetical protein CF319_g201 [Tilletia indica]|nr:hypothetical protein CF319_g201 [Tilletia indica]